MPGNTNHGIGTGWIAGPGLAGCLLVTWVAITSAHADEAKQRAHGQHLSSECSACHRIDGVDNGIPSITGWPVATFETTMDFYRTGARPNQVMMSVVQSLDAAQVKALALYYGSLPKPVRAPR